MVQDISFSPEKEGNGYKTCVGEKESRWAWPTPTLVTQRNSFVFCLSFDQNSPIWILILQIS